MTEPVLVTIAASLATRAFAGLYALVRAKFADDPEATAALTAAEGAAPGSPQVAALAEALRRAEAEDPPFGDRLRREHERVTLYKVDNKVTGGANHQVVQAGEITGDITFK
ncbi:hypothetical protein [Saccharothrix sp.]|uniref:hypothetical protein n=1 Tax=Saccharothrix sp. TaxID=1873460 RepID=UPI0028111E92|nr:hypothetical protein [Saccharothrix sp.]